MGTKAKWNAGRLSYYDAVSFETLAQMSPVVFYDDFLGDAGLVIPAAASEESGVVWSKKIVGNAPPTVALAAGANGLAQCALTSTSQKQNADLYMSDRRLFSMLQGVVFEARLKVSVAPTGAAQLIWGLAGDWADGPDAITYGCWFKQDAAASSTAVVVEMDDDVTNTDDTATAITLATTDWKIYKIDASNYSSVKFYIDGARVAGSTTFTWAASTANSVVQPYVSCYKASGTGVGTIQVDYIKVYQNRS